MWARVWKTHAAAEEALKAEVCSLSKLGIGVMRKAPRLAIKARGGVIEPVLVEGIKGRVADQMVAFPPVPPVTEEIIAVVQGPTGTNATTD